MAVDTQTAQDLLLVLNQEFDALKIQNLAQFEALQDGKARLLARLEGVSPDAITEDVRDILIQCRDAHRRNETLIQHQLVAIRGIGRWTAEMFLIFHLKRPNVLPLDDIGLQNGISRCYFSGEPVSRSEIREVATGWAPFCSVATWYIWRSLDPVPVAY